MESKIKILPQSLANQIAAGEVVQRPSSVIKELIENSIDAQADKIEINVKNGGKTLIQVIDNGIGMNPIDARMAFERHATSKIQKPQDLFHITTKGFRGEALASIAAVAKVELITKTKDQEIGTRIIIEGNKLILQEPIKCPTGANFIVKNLFFNVPARRRFLKSDNTEFRHILTEFYRVAIPHNDIEFSLTHNSKIFIKLKKTPLKERIIKLFDKSYNEQLIPIEADLNFLKISGFITKPEFAKKTKADQYFFVNKRFMKNAYFHKAVINGYGNLLPDQARPSYFIFFDINPEMIDVNIHPTKTEINFQNAEQIFQLLSSTVKNALIKFKITPSIDFDNIEFANIQETSTGKIPYPKINTEYNPFIEAQKNEYPEKDDLFIEISKQEPEVQRQPDKILIFKNKYAITLLSRSIAIIDIKKALQQINYEKIINNIKNPLPSLPLIYPMEIKLTAQEMLILETLQQYLEFFGFKIEKKEKSIIITSKPEILPIEQTEEVLKKMIEFTQDSKQAAKDYLKEKIAEIIAKNSTFNTKNYTKQEVFQIISELFTLSSVEYSFDGKKIIYEISEKELAKMLK